MQLTNKNLVPGTKYIISIVGVVEKGLAECTELKDRHGQNIVKVLNKGIFHNLTLKGDDYIPVEIYDEQKHGVIE